MKKKSEVLKEGQLKALKDAKVLIEAEIGQAPVTEPEKRIIWGDSYECIKNEEENVKRNALEDPETFDYLFDENGELDDAEVQDSAYENLNLWLDDVKVNLADVGSDHGVIVKGQLGLWYGNRDGMKVYDDFVKAFTSIGEDYNEVYIQNGKVIMEAQHHDGTNVFEFFTINQEVAKALEDEVCEKFYDEVGYDIDLTTASGVMEAYDYDILTDEQFDSLLISLADEISAVYGW